MKHERRDRRSSSGTAECHSSTDRARGLAHLVVAEDQVVHLTQAQPGGTQEHANSTRAETLDSAAANGSTPRPTVLRSESQCGFLVTPEQLLGGLPQPVGKCATGDGRKELIPTETLQFERVRAGLDPRTPDELAAALPTMFRRALELEGLLPWTVATPLGSTGRPTRERRLDVLNCTSSVVVDDPETLSTCRG